VNSKLKLAVTLLIIFLTFSPFLMFSVYADPGPAACIKVSLPEGTCVGYDPDPWLSECWLLNLTGSSQTFTVRVNNTSAAKRSYDTRLIIALNDEGYNNLENLIVNRTCVPKSAFQYGTPTPYNLGWTWPSGDVYLTWSNDTLVNIGTIERKGFKDVVVSVTFSNATNVRMHFDAYGCTVYPPTKKGDIVHNGISEDSTVLFQPGPPAPQPPYAHFFYDPSYPNSNDMVTFNASESYDPDGDIVSYSWDFGDGTPIVTESDPITNHTYTTFGNYTVTLTVVDNDNLTANATATIYVSQHPVAAFSFSPLDPLEHEVVTFDASASTPDGGTIISYEWNFGDGNITMRPDPIITHAYSEFGNYTVTLNVTDSEGKWDTESKLVTVEALPIADFWWSPFYPRRCENVTFDASSSTPDGGVIVSYAWDFSDGTPIVIESSPITTHNYTTVGNYTVTLNVTDSEGRWDTESKIITVVARRYLVTFTQTGLDATADGTIVTVNGSAKTFADLPFSMWVDENTQISYTYESIVASTTSDKRFVLIDVTGLASPITVTESVTIVGNYKTQCYLTITSPHGSPTPTSGWFDVGTEITASVTSPWSGPAGVQHVCTGWTGTGSAPASGTTTSVSFTINEPSSITWNWKTQYYLTVQTNPADLSPAPTPPSDWYDEGTNVILTAPDTSYLNSDEYSFEYWDVDGASQGISVNPITITMNQPHTATAHYTLVTPPPPPLSVSISPTSATVYIGSSVTFTSTVSGGVPPYTYQWYFDNSPVAGATSSSWTYTPPSASIHYVHVEVTDSAGNSFQSDPARVVVASTPVGGYSISLIKQTPTSHIVAHTMLIALFAVTISLIRRKRK